MFRPCTAVIRCKSSLPKFIHHSLMELSPSWETANYAPTQELPSVLWNPKVHCRVHKSPPMVPILSQIDPIHTIPPYLSKIHFNIVHPPMSWSSQWSLSFWISLQYPICIPLLPHSCYMACPSQIVPLYVKIIYRVWTQCWLLIKICN
jgi:hypothetical protein